MRTNIKLGFKYCFYTEKMLSKEFMKSHPDLILQYSMKTLKAWGKKHKQTKKPHETFQRRLLEINFCR